MLNKGLFSAKTYEWGTPKDLFDDLDKEFHFTLDPCSSRKNHKCKKYYTIKQNGLNKSWKDEIVFMNPPYGRGIIMWLIKAVRAKTTVVCLLPARTDTIWFHKYIYNNPLCEIRFLKGRLKFEGFDKNKPCKYFNNTAPFPSMIVVFSNKGTAI